MPTPAARKAVSGFKIMPIPAWDWPRGIDRVEVKRITRRGDTYAVDAVHINGANEPIGYVVGRPDVMDGRRWWDHAIERDAAMNPSTQAGMVYPTASRQHAICALIEEVQREEPQVWCARHGKGCQYGCTR